MIGVFTKRMRFARAFKSRPFSFIWLGQTISNLGDGMFNVALAWQVLLMTHSGTAMGLVLIASTVPRLVFLLIGGVAADRLPRRLIILWSDGGRGAIVLLISILGFMGYLQFWQLIIEALVFGVVDGFFNPAILAITPDLVEKDELASANALNSFSGNLAQLFGPLLGALLIALFTPMGAFFADALSFFISVAFLLSVRIPERHVAMQAEGAESIPLVLVGEAEGTPLAMAEMTEGTVALQVEAGAASESGRGFRGVIADVLEGLVYVRSSPWLWVTIVGAAVGNIGFTASLAVAMPKLVHDVYGQGPWLLGLLSTAGAIGSIAALLSISQATHLKKRGLLAYLSLSLPAIGLVLFGLPFPRSEAPLIASLASMLVGFGLAFFNTIWFTVLHETIPSNKLGRVISLDSLGSFAMVPIGEGLGGVLTDHIGPAQVFVIFGLFNLVLNLIPLLIKEIRRME
jgi:MFS family permease